MKPYTTYHCKDCRSFCALYFDNYDFFHKETYIEKLDIGLCSRHERIVKPECGCTRWWAAKEDSQHTALNIESIMFKWFTIRQRIKGTKENSEE